MKEQIAPTKSNLIRVKERLNTALEGYDLLEQKREILVMELMRQVEQVKILERDLDARIATAYPQTICTTAIVSCSHGSYTLSKINN